MSRFCAICNHPISPADMQRKRYVYSQTTGRYYCIRCGVRAKAAS